MGAHDCVPTELTFFERKVEDLAAFVAEQDVFWVAGGSTANLLAVWRLHGLDELLRAAHARGAVLAGVSAGMNCWFEGSTTDSFDLTQLAALPDGLGLLPGSCCTHFDGRRTSASISRYTPPSSPRSAKAPSSMCSTGDTFTC